MFVPKSARASWKSLAKYRNVSPARFGIDRNVRPGTTFPLYTLFAWDRSRTQAGDTVVKTNTVGGQSISVAIPPRDAYQHRRRPTPATRPRPTAATTTRRHDLGRDVHDRGDHDSASTRVDRVNHDDRDDGDSLGDLVHGDRRARRIAPRRILDARAQARPARPVVGDRAARRPRRRPDWPRPGP